MTGIARVSKESIFSDINNLKVITTTSDKYATAFGFIEEEVFATLREYGYSHQKKNIKEWYDVYWANTSSVGLISSLIQKSGSDIKTTFEELMNGKTIKCTIDEQLVYNHLTDNETAIWSLLVASGYLKVVEVEDLPIYELAITNGEVKRMFRNMIQEMVLWDQNQSDFIMDLGDMMLC